MGDDADGITAVLLDIDDTLVDTHGAFRHALAVVGSLTSLVRRVPRIWSPRGARTWAAGTAPSLAAK